MSAIRVILGFKKDWDDNISITNKIKNKLIQWWTDSKYYHVEICLDNVWISSEPKSGGVNKKKLRLTKGKNWDYYELQVEELTPIQKLILCDFLNKQIGTGYDWLGIFSQVFRMFRDNRRKWFCSEIVSKILQLMYVEELLDYEPSQISPGKLFNLLRKKLIPVKEITYIEYEVEEDKLKL